MNGLPVSWGAPRPERADAARNRAQLLATARQMLTESGPDQLTMDALAERSGLGKGTVFRRFGTRAGIFQGLLDEVERGLQEQVLSGPPPLGPGAPPVDRLVAYGRARVRWLMENTEIARFALDGRQPVPGGSQTPASQMHIRMLLRHMDLGGLNVDVLAIQLTAALDGPLLLYLSTDALANAGPQVEQNLGAAWQDLVERVCRP
ncbi:TetR/AcrR family transcriptional regulator [Streptomyces aurantiacus]|uniref:Transcriptional regulator, TetR family protein n=1 Tax=Streptomyces aurantiacus TaxID=47760 RepID=A0A7G1PBX0_9ACTN|nr:TetR/AcrR family transcriptional regulator [Streptomyces aurantiacus]BCL33123.1 putative transcriptional regulator, TetR family protein [Streptomyces aurantiacus]